MATVYVDSNGNPVSTSNPASPDPTVGAAEYGGDDRDHGSPYNAPWGDHGSSPAPMPTPSSGDATSEAPSTPPPQTSEAPAPYSESAPDTSSAPPPQSASPGTTYDDDGDVVGYSIAYAPYNADNSCKSESEIDADIDDLNPYGMVRIYGTDCDQVRIVMNAAKRNDMKVFLGIWDISQASNEASIIVDAAKNDWKRVHSVSVGNELMKTTAVEDIVSAIGTARSVLTAGGYEGFVTTVDVWITFKEKLTQSNGLCEAVDYIAANCHPFFDAETTAEEAGDWVARQADTIAGNCPKEVMITESGWPTEGSPNGLAVPGVENQKTVVEGLKRAYADRKDKLVLFSAFNDPWKTDNQWGVEHYWGINGNAPSARRK